MRKFLLLIMILTIAGCVTVGKFPEKRNRLHEIGQEEDYCQKYPDRCIDGVAW